MKKMAVLVANGYEDMELVVPIDLFKKNDIDFDLISVDNHDLVNGRYNAIVPTIHMNTIDKNDYDSIYIPGGSGIDIIEKNEYVLNMIKEFNDKKMFIYAICRAPSVLRELGILDNIKHTAFPSFELKKTFIRENVVQDKNIITASGPGASVQFALAIIKNIKGIEIYNNVKKSLKIY